MERIWDKMLFLLWYPLIELIDESQRIRRRWDKVLLFLWYPPIEMIDNKGCRLGNKINPRVDVGLRFGYSTDNQGTRLCWTVTEWWPSECSLMGDRWQFHPLNLPGALWALRRL